MAYGHEKKGGKDLGWWVGSGQRGVRDGVGGEWRYQ